MRAVAAGVLVGLALVLAACGSDETFEVTSENMLPTIESGDELEIDRSAYDDAEPRLGDIVVLRPPSGADDQSCGAPNPAAGQICPRPTEDFSDRTFVERVVAGPGDRVSLRGGRLVRNGALVREPYIRPCAADAAEDRGCDLPRVTVIPRNHWLVLGDNRGEAEDSRFWGPVPVGAILGPVKR